MKSIAQVMLGSIAVAVFTYAVTLAVALAPYIPFH